MVITMTNVFCDGTTCRYNLKGLCRLDSINLKDFEYYKSADNKEKDYLDDDMRCMSYISKYSGKGVDEE